MIIEKYRKTWVLLQQMRGLGLGTAAREAYVTRILPKHMNTECPPRMREFVRLELVREARKAA